MDLKLQLAILGEGDATFKPSPVSFLKLADGQGIEKLVGDQDRRSIGNVH